MEKIFSQNERKYALLFFLQWYSLKIFDSTLTLDIMPWTGLTYNDLKPLEEVSISFENSIFPKILQKDFQTKFLAPLESFPTCWRRAGKGVFLDMFVGHNMRCWTEGYSFKKQLLFSCNSKT